MAAHVSDAAHLSQQQQQVVQHHPRRIQLSMPTPHFVVTGFGQFAGVTANPTQALVEWLHKEKLCPGVGTQAAQHSTAVQSPRSTPTSTKLEDGYKISSCTVLEVSADAVCQYLQQQATLLQEACSSSEQQPVVLLHLGVDTQVRLGVISSAVIWASHSRAIVRRENHVWHLHNQPPVLACPSACRHHDRLPCCIHACNCISCMQLLQLSLRFLFLAAHL